MKLSTFLFSGILALTNAATLTVKPGESIQAAIEKAMPGDTIKLSDGEYSEDLETVRDGEQDKYITITGTHKAIVRGTGKEGRMFKISHNYHRIDGFELNGMLNDGKKESDYIDKGIYAHGNRKPRIIKQYGTEFKSAIDGLQITNMRIVNFGGECSRMRYYITNARYTGNYVANCGVHDFVFGGMAAVNGETLYVGTSSNQWDDGKNPTPDDESRYIYIGYNVFESQANEVDVKEGSSHVLMEYNQCSTQKDPNSSCLDSRTDAVVFRYNTVFNNVGAAVRVGGHTIKGHTYGQNNEIYGNVFKNNQAGALKVQTGPHVATTFCENKCEGTCEVGGSVSKDYKDIEGKCSGNMDIFWVDGTKAAKVVSNESEGSKDSSDGEPTEESEPDVKVSVKSNDKDSEDSKDSKDSKGSSDSKCYPVKIKDLKTSSDGDKTASLAVDGKALTRWSVKGKDEWIELDFGSDQEVNAVEISFYKGDSRVQEFDVYIEGKAVLEKGKSDGKSLDLERFEFKPTKGSSITVMGKGNNENAWNSLSELIVCGTSKHDDNGDSSEENDKETGKCDKVRKLEVGKISATSEQGDNKVENLLDGNLNTRWSAEGPDPQEILIKLDEPSFILDIGIAVHKGDTRQNQFDVLALTNRGWQEIIIDGTSKKGVGIESYDMGVEYAEEVKIVCYGYDDLKTGETGQWNSITQVELYGC